MKGSDIPAISVVIPTCGRPRSLDSCLRALTRQDVVHPFDVIVVDDGWDEETRKVLAAWEGHGCVPIRHLTSARPKSGPAAARNLGWQAARASIIAFTDDDTEPEPDWLSEGLSSLGRDLVAVAGRVEVPLRAEPTDYEKSFSELEVAGFVTANCFVRRVALTAIGGFDERFPVAWREDSDLYFALIECFGPESVGTAPRARVVHPVLPAPWGVSLKLQKKAQYNALLFKKHPTLYRSKIQRHPPWQYYAIVLSLAGGASATILRHHPWAVALLTAWGVLTLSFFGKRLRGTSKRPSHVLEVLVTSFAIPPLAVFWRLAGAFRYRVPFL